MRMAMISGPPAKPSFTGTGMPGITKGNDPKIRPRNMPHWKVSSSPSSSSERLRWMQSRAVSTGFSLWWDSRCSIFRSMVMRLRPARLRWTESPIQSWMMHGGSMRESISSTLYAGMMGWLPPSSSIMQSRWIRSSHRILRSSDWWWQIRIIPSG